MAAGPVFGDDAEDSSVGHWYLYPVLNSLYPDGIAKITYNSSTGDFVLRGHGLEAGKEFELRSGGPLGDGATGVAVGNGTAGLGNNVLIKGNVCGADLGRYWNLWVDDEFLGWTRVLRSEYVDPPLAAPACE